MRRRVLYVILDATVVCFAAMSAEAASLQEFMASCRRNSDLSARVAACTVVIERSRDRRALLRAYNTRGLALCDLDRFAEAVPDFDQVLKLDSSIAGYFDNRARALRGANRYADAIADSDRAIKMAPTYAFTYMGKAYSLEASGQIEQALDVTEQALHLDPANSGNWEYRGQLAGRLHRYDLAYASYDRALALEPSMVSVYKLRAETEAAQGNVDAALADYARYPASGDDAEEVKRAAEALRMKVQAQQEAEKAAVERQEAARRLAAAERATELERQRADAEKARADAAVSAKSTQVTVSLVNPADKAAPPLSAIDEDEAKRLNKSLGELAAQVAALRDALDEQKRLKKDANGDVITINETIVLVSKQLSRRQTELESGTKRLDAYLTSIRPADRDQYASARRATQAYPRIPYYIPGTPETGEFWIEPTVEETGVLLYQLRFVDPLADYNKVRESISMTPSELSDTQAALTKVRAWSRKAHEVGLRKTYSKRAACFPQADCPEDGSTIEGKSSTEIRFNLYEDGSTAGRIQRNKGRFVEGYNISTDSALLLSAYIAYAKKIAERDFTQGTQTKQDLDKLFR